MNTSKESTLHHAIEMARSRKAPFAFAICADSTHHPEIAQQAKSIIGSNVHLMDVSGMSASEARHAFIGAVCRDSSIIAFGIGSDAEAASAILDGLASIGQWNKAATALGIASAAPAITHSGLSKAATCLIASSALLRKRHP